MSEITLRPRTSRTAAASLALAFGATSAAGAAAVAVAPAAHAATTYTVQAGQGWYAISRASGVSLATLFSLNGMNINTVVHPGQVLKTSGTATASSTPTSSTGTYTVKAGDNWYSISRYTGVPVSTLLSLNGKSATSTLRVGDVVKTSLSVVATSTVTSYAAPAPAPTPAVNRQAAIDYVKAKINATNTYYTWGGNGPYGFDCSGLMQQAYAKAGISIPRLATDQYNAAKTHVPLSQAQPGDLVFWYNPSTGRMYHVAMYLGNGQLGNALNETQGITYSNLSTLMVSDRVAMVARY